jgi:DNA-binding NarL/FixJ family response regulator
MVNRRLRVLVADDHDLFRTGLASLLEAQPDIELIGTASGGRMAVELAVAHRPDVILMDVKMPDMDGPAATRAILSSVPDARVLALTVVSDERDVEEALEAGACGFVSKDTPVERILMAVRAAAEGAAWLSPRAAEVVLGRMRRERPEPAPPGEESHNLSPRELEVLRLIARGLENPSIADALGISQHTVRKHVSSILSKLGLPSRVQAAVYAVRRQLD